MNKDNECIDITSEDLLFVICPDIWNAAVSAMRESCEAARQRAAERHATHERVAGQRATLEARMRGAI